MKKGKILALIMLLLAAAVLLSACGAGQADNGEVKNLSFKASSSYDDLKAFNNTRVTINGYLATSSPADGSFIFLMNLPYQSCPFCVPNTSQLSNTIEVYPKKGQKFSYTSQAVRVTGKLEVAPTVNDFFTDPYGYQFNFRIADAEYTIIKDSDMSAEMAAWQKIANSGIVDALYNMYDYVNFIVDWPNYKVNSYEDENGNMVPGFYLYASDALNFLTQEDSQYNYGYQRQYFTTIRKALESLKVDAAAPLAENIRKAETLARKAEQELLDGNYSEQLQYVEEFGQEDHIFTLNNGENMRKEMDALYTEFADWLASWEV